MRSTTVIVAHNHRAHIERCLRTLMPTLSSTDEVIVVDNASTDGTAELVAHTFPAVRLVRNRHNRGFGAACNQAAEYSGADYLAFLNPDTEPRAGWLDALLEALGSAADTGLATPKLLLLSHSDRINAFGHDIHITGIATCRAWGESADSHGEVEQVAAISGACFAIPRPIFHYLGGFDERLFLYYEDDDLSLRARLAGYNCIAVPQARVLHDHNPAVSAVKLRHLERNRIWTLLKVLDGKTLAVLAPTLASGEVLAWGMACRAGLPHMRAKLQSWVDVMSMLPQLSAARCRIARKISGRELLKLHKTDVSLAQLEVGGFASLALPALNAWFAGMRLVIARFAS